MNENGWYFQKPWNICFENIDLLHYIEVMNKGVYRILSLLFFDISMYLFPGLVSFENDSPMSLTIPLVWLCWPKSGSMANIRLPTRMPSHCQLSYVSIFPYVLTLSFWSLSNPRDRTVRTNVPADFWVLFSYSSPSWHASNNSHLPQSFYWISWWSQIMTMAILPRIYSMKLKF